MIATLLLSQGTPMILMGDEVGRTQGGNNNAYCQDNEISWLNWDRITDEDREFFRFVQRLTHIRRTRPLLRQSHFLHGREIEDGIRDVMWLRPDGAEMVDENWSDPHARAIACLLAGDRTAESAPAVQRLADWRSRSSCRSPARRGSWRVVVDTEAEESGRLPENARIRARRLVRAAAAHPQRCSKRRAYDREPSRDRFAYPLPFGAEVMADGQTRFRLWAPDHHEVAVCFEASGAVLAMQREEGGWFSLTTEAGPGTAYRYRLRSGMLVPDPASRARPQDVHGASLVVDPRAYRWHNPAGRAAVGRGRGVCELHVGTATPEGTFEGLRRRLDHLVDPASRPSRSCRWPTFPGPAAGAMTASLLFAPERSYGGRTT
jgi:isoamylase